MNKDNQKQSQKTPEFDDKSASERLEELGKLSPRDIDVQIDKPRTTNAQPETNKRHSKAVIKPKRPSIDHKQLDESYNKIMARVHNELPVSNRLFSKIIHNKFIEITSDIIGSTISRPNAILFGAVFAFISTLILYVTAKTIGYSLSGSESIIAFVIGWAIGLSYDFLRLIILGSNIE